MTERKFYLFKRMDNVTWDEFDGFVICAKDENEARSLLKDHWDRRQIEEQKWEVTVMDTKESIIILESFNAG